MKLSSLASFIPAGTGSFPPSFRLMILRMKSICSRIRLVYLPMNRGGQEGEYPLPSQNAIERFRLTPRRSCCCYRTEWLIAF